MDRLPAPDPAQAEADPFVRRLWLRAQRYVATDQLGAAKAALEALVHRAPALVAARMLLASVYLHDGEVRMAAAQAVAAAAVMPDDAEVFATTAACLLRVGETVAARDCLARFDASHKDLGGRQLVALAQAFQSLGDHRAALALLDQADVAAGGDVSFRYFHALQLQFNGHLDRARHCLRGCLQTGPMRAKAILALARMSTQTAESNHLACIREQLRCAVAEDEDYAALQFARYKELEDLGRREEAFAALERGNAAIWGRHHRDAEREDEVFPGLERFAATARDERCETPIAGPIPIFIVGMPRSGTTVLDRMLDNHPDVVSAGECSDFPRQLRWVADRHGTAVMDLELLRRLPDVDPAELHRRYLEQTQWRARGARFYVDKLPANFLLLGLIQRALPQAPILHLVRDPMDVCFSNYRTLFSSDHSYSYRPDALARHYVHYRKLMQLWRQTLPGAIFDVDYRALVTRPEATMSAVLTHCGLPVVPGCSDLSRNHTAVSTLSSAQVREPVHQRSVGAWQRYARQLEPLAASLRAAGRDAAT